MNKEAEQLLKKAGERIFSLGLRDLSSVLSHENMLYGLGKMLHVAEQAYCVFGPDATITRNVGRWLSGFGYGCVIRWKPKGVYFPEIRPNGCGMILVKIDELPTHENLLEKISEIERSELSLDGIKIKPDFGKGNHFLEFYSVSRAMPEIEDKISKEHHYALLHGSASEKKDGLYEMIDQGTWVKTPLGKISVLDGNSGKEYYRRWRSLEDFSNRRRELLAKELLQGCEIISNLTHQGMFSENEIRMGCHDTSDKSNKGKTIFPIALRWDLPLYLFRGKQNISDDVINMLNFDKRAHKLGIMEELKNINLLPHGGGYSVSLPYTRLKMMKTESFNNFILSGAKQKLNGEIHEDRANLSEFGEMVVTTPHDLPYNYRGMKVISKTLEYDLGTPIAMLQPLMTFKI